MEVDAAQYAEMSWEMLWKKNFLQPTCLHTPYLDKPPLLFWLNTISFFVLGISNVSYKLFSLLFAALAVYSVHGFVKVFYGEYTARIAAVMLASTQAMFIMTNDVRTDTMLMGSVMLALWQWAIFFETGKTKNLIWASVGLGLALLAKGPIGFIAVSVSLFPHLLLKKKLKLLLDRRLFLSAGLVALMLLPMSIGLYQQHGMAGLRFYFWTQSFGRITGESEWNNHPDTFFLVQNTLWQFLPWTIFLIGGWLTKVTQLTKLRLVPWSAKEFVSISGFTLVLLSLSLSKYQLPHYVFIVFPLATVLAANYFTDTENNKSFSKLVMVIQILLVALLSTSAILLQWSFKGFDLISLLLLLFMLSVVWLLLLKTKNKFYFSVAAICAFNLLFSLFYFPEMLKYQHGNSFGKYVKEQTSPETGYVFYHCSNDFSTTFYAQQMPDTTLWNREGLRSFVETHHSSVIVTNQYGFDELKADNMKFEIIQQQKSIRISQLNLKFLNPGIRHELGETMYLLSIKNPPDNAGRI